MPRLGAHTRPLPALLDPLAELVKVDPQSVGVGLYQHDVDQAQLAAASAGVVESVVNRVGVDVNTASPALLAHVAGIGPKLAARNVVDFGAFVDIGVKHDGLLHRSKILAGIRLQVGDVIEVEVLRVEPERGRIALGWAKEITDW